ncbi:MAG: hypothetical protein HYW63_04060 [Candidatus Levybacteria bacterium]|nr:hypothetical protein [Candidatus Levybacteria bacterium]
MPEFETQFGRVTFDEVERDISKDGGVSIVRFRSHSLGALEETVAFLRDSGLFVPVDNYQEPGASESTTETVGRPPITVYLACPAPEDTFFFVQKESPVSEFPPIN